MTSPTASASAIGASRIRYASRRLASTRPDDAAEIATGFAAGFAAVRSFPWASLRCPHLQALRAELAARHAPATGTGQLPMIGGAPALPLALPVQ